MEKDMKREKLSKTAATGAVALIFLILGFQIAVFFGNVFGAGGKKTTETDFSNVSEQIFETQVSDNEIFALVNDATEDDERKIDYQISGNQTFDSRKLAGSSKRSLGSKSNTNVDNSAYQRIADATNAPARRDADFADSRTVIAEKYRQRRKELFVFNPNTISRDSLVLLGFSERQADVIVKYRSKGGRYYTKRDFAKSYVVDSVMFVRLEPYICIPKIDLNTADSAALVSLPGIGPYYAKKILVYRSMIGGKFEDKNQLLEIDGFDEERYSKLKDFVKTGSENDD